jgi:hypothetical protein
MPNTVRHNPDGGRYELVDPGGELVQGTLDALRHDGSRVVPQCWYVAQYIDEHPEYEDLLAVTPR